MVPNFFKFSLAVGSTLENIVGQHIRLKHLFRVEAHKSVTFGSGLDILD